MIIEKILPLTAHFFKKSFCKVLFIYYIDYINNLFILKNNCNKIHKCKIGNYTQTHKILLLD